MAGRSSLDSHRAARGGKRKAGDFRSTLATGGGVDSTFGLKKREDEQKAAAGVVNGFERITQERAAQLADEVRREQDAASRKAGERRITQEGTGQASARFKFEDLQGRTTRPRKKRYRNL